MKNLRLLFGVMCAALLAMVPAKSLTWADPWAVGDVFAGVGDPRFNGSVPGRYAVYSETGQPRTQSIQIPGADARASAGNGYTTGCYYNPQSSTFFGTTFNANSVHEFDGTAWLRRLDVGAVDPNITAVESIAFAPNGQSFFVGMPYSFAPGPQIARFNYTPAAGATFADKYTVPAGLSGNSAVDWVDVTTDGANNPVIYYTDESGGAPAARVYRYDVATQQRTLFIDSNQLPGSKAFALRLLPQNSGLLVVTSQAIYRFNMQGQRIYDYYVPGEFGFFAVNITPDGKYFWTATSKDDDASPFGGRMHKFHIASSHTPILSVDSGYPSIAGLCVKMEYTAAQNVCSSSTGAPIACPRLEICNEGGDDDGDGLVDLQDPDCVRPGTAETCEPERADENRNGLANEGCEVIRDERTSIPAVGELPMRVGPAGQVGATYTIVAGSLPPALTLNSSTGEISGTLTDGQTGLFSATIQVTKSSGETSTGVYPFRILDVNRPPVVANPVVSAASEGTPYSLQINASDPDTATDLDALSYAADNLPAGLTINAATGLISGTPTYTSAGLYQVVVTVNDNHAANSTPTRPLQPSLTSSVSFQLAVNNTNRPPVITSVPSPGPYSTSTPQLTNVRVVGSDPDGDAVSIIGIIVPPGFLVDTDGYVTFAPGFHPSAQTYSFTVRAADPSGATSQNTTFTLTFTDGPPPPPPVTDQPPVCDATAVAPLVWPPNHKLVEIPIIGVTDPDGDQVTIQITGIRQDEPTNTQGDGNTDVDGFISPDGRTAYVRSERAGTPQLPGDGRVYEILYTATANGLSCTGMVSVGVPHDQSKPVKAIRSPMTYNSLTGAPIVINQ